MDKATRKQMFQLLESYLKELGIESKYVSGAGAPQLGDTLLTMVPVMGAGDLSALMEIALVDMGDNLYYLQFYSTLIMDCADAQDEFYKCLNDMNFFTPVGSFGIFRQQRQLFHKYSIIVGDGETAENVAERALTALHAVTKVHAWRMPLISGIYTGELNYETVAAKGLFTAGVEELNSALA